MNADVFCQTESPLSANCFLSMVLASWERVFRAPGDWRYLITIYILYTFSSFSGLSGLSREVTDYFYYFSTSGI